MADLDFLTYEWQEVTGDQLVELDHSRTNMVRERFFNPERFYDSSNFMPGFSVVQTRDEGANHVYATRQIYSPDELDGVLSKNDLRLNETMVDFLNRVLSSHKPLL
jgi:hypothetical protein